MSAEPLFERSPDTGPAANAAIPCGARYSIERIRTMKQQDLKALTGRAIERAVAAREVAGVELTAEQTASVAGGAGGLSYIKDPTWFGIWETLKVAQLPRQVEVGIVAQPVGIGPNEKLEAGIASGKVGF
jgi:hypothetical protein